MTKQKDIGKRLENWSTWCRSANLRGKGADCMTGAVCERMRRASLGDVWSGHAIDERHNLDERDAILIERGMRDLVTLHRLMLYWTYIEMARPEIVCRKLSLPVRPASAFVEAFRAAQDAIEQAVDNLMAKG